MKRNEPGAALITGASTGIGRALAFEFAKGGYPLVLVSRDQAALEAVAKACHEAHGVESVVVAMDLSIPGAAGEVARRLEKLGVNVEILVNNAGVGLHGPFLQTAISAEIAMVQLQLVCALELTKLFLPGMVQRRRGRVLNVGSLYSFTPVPQQSVYAACKAFLYSFSAALADEVSTSGITITTLCPGITLSEFRRRAGLRDKKAGFATMTPEAVASCGYRALMRGRRVSIPGWQNRLFVTVVSLFPPAVLTRLMRMINRIRGVHRH